LKEFEAELAKVVLAKASSKTPTSRSVGATARIVGGDTRSLGVTDRIAGNFLVVVAEEVICPPL
jgi:hypothetical protein